MRNDVFKCFELVFQDPWLSIISSHIINMSKQHRPIEIQFPGRFIGSDSVSRGVAWMLQDSALGPDRDQRGCLQAAGFVWCQGRSNCWGCRMCVLSSTLESLRKETCFFFLRCFGRSCWSFMVYMNHDSKIHGTIPALHPGLGKCIRPWKAPWKSLSKNRPNAVAICLEGGMPWWDPVLQDLLRDTSSDFKEVCVCVCVWMDFTEVSLVFHLRTFKPSKPDDKMLGLRAQAAHSTQLRSKCPVPPLESSLYIANGEFGGNWTVLQLAFVVCLHVFSQFPSMYQENWTCCSLDWTWTAEGAVFRCSSGMHAIRTTHLYTFPTPNLYPVCCLKVSTKVLLSIFCPRVASSGCQKYLIPRSPLESRPFCKIHWLERHSLWL